MRSEEHTSELQSPCNLVCRLLLEKKKNKKQIKYIVETKEALSECVSCTHCGDRSLLQAHSCPTTNSVLSFFFFFFFFFFKEGAPTKFSLFPPHPSLPT